MSVGEAPNGSGAHLVTSDGVAIRCHMDPAATIITNKIPADIHCVESRLSMRILKDPSVIVVGDIVVTNNYGGYALHAISLIKRDGIALDKVAASKIISDAFPIVVGDPIVEDGIVATTSYIQPVP